MLFTAEILDRFVVQEHISVNPAGDLHRTVSTRKTHKKHPHYHIAFIHLATDLRPPAGQDNTNDHCRDHERYFRR